jgi:hypothetical protein
MKAPGRKNVPKTAIVFIDKLSALFAFAMAAELSANAILTFASFAAMNWKTFGGVSLYYRE